MRRFQTEIKRENYMYALKMLENMRGYILEIQALNENKKLHQFKAFETLDLKFIKNYLSTYPIDITVEELSVSAVRLNQLFLETIKKSNLFSIDESITKILSNKYI